jgi:hypothetical protein
MLLLLFAIIPHDLIAEDHFDRIELNHLHETERATIVLDQYIFWHDGHVQAWFIVLPKRKQLPDLDEEEQVEWRAAEAKFKEAWIEKRKQEFVRKWKGIRPLKQILFNWHPPKPPAYNPPFRGKLPDRARGKWQLVFHKDGILRRITADAFMETWTIGVDPEVMDREKFKISERRGLTGEPR